LGGKVTATNAALDDEPTLVNEDPYGEGWIVKLRASDAKAYDGLMSAKAYEAFLKSAAED
jgi:glycine cleavage system H protein